MDGEPVSLPAGREGKKMSQIELRRRILARLEKQIAFGGLTKRKTTEGEIILKCPIWATGASLEPLAEDLAYLLADYVGEMSLKQLRDMIKAMLE